MGEAESTPAPQRIVLFDGVCNFCDGAVRWLLDRDRQGRLRFAPLQGATAAALRLRHPEIPADIDTLVLVEADAAGERVHLRSDAVLRVLALVGVAPAWLRLAARLPRKALWASTPAATAGWAS